LSLSAKTDVMDKVVLLELGADDYVTKPFSPRELLARVRAAVRPTGESKVVNVFAFGDISIDFAKMEIVRGGQPVSMTPYELVLRIIIETCRPPIAVELDHSLHFPIRSSIIAIPARRSGSAGFTGTLVPFSTQACVPGEKRGAMRPSLISRVTANRCSGKDQASVVGEPIRRCVDVSLQGRDASTSAERHQRKIRFCCTKIASGVEKINLSKNPSGIRCC